MRFGIVRDIWIIVELVIENFCFSNIVLEDYVFFKESEDLGVLLYYYVIICIFVSFFVVDKGGFFYLERIVKLVFYVILLIFINLVLSIF